MSTCARQVGICTSIKSKYVKHWGHDQQHQETHFNYWLMIILAGESDSNQMTPRKLWKSLLCYLNPNLQSKPLLMCIRFEPVTGSVRVHWVYSDWFKTNIWISRLLNIWILGGSKCSEDGQCSCKHWGSKPVRTATDNQLPSKNAEVSQRASNCFETSYIRELSQNKSWLF